MEKVKGMAISSLETDFPYKVGRGVAPLPFPPLRN